MGECGIPPPSLEAGGEWTPLAGAHGQRPLVLREDAGDRKRIATLNLTGDCLDALASKTVLAEGCTLEGEWKNASDAGVWPILTTERFRPLQ